MDLTSFTKVKKDENREIIKEDSDVKITKIGSEKIEFNFGSVEELRKYQDFLFFSPTNSMIYDSEDIAEDFFRKSIEDGTEGIMVKNLQATYKPGIRTGAMGKLKEVKEDIDVVIIGAEHGRGKRAGYFSSFYVGVKSDDVDSDEIYMVGKVSSGIKELDGEGATMDRLTQLLKPLKINEEKGVTYFEPKVIIQVRYQEIQKSTTYNSGFALRFPRIISLREDKALDEINSISDVENFSKF